MSQIDSVAVAHAAFNIEVPKSFINLQSFIFLKYLTGTAVWRLPIYQTNRLSFTGNT